ncbi:MAG: helix-turn-helix domain-containing protein [Patescibacteria group bacterium]
MLKEQLEKMGMAEKEAKVFLASLELGSSAVQEIAKKADINRATTYVIIEKLMKKGLMSSVEKGKKTYFQTEDPKRLLKLLEEQEEGLKRKEEEFKKYLPELETLFNIAEEKPKVRFFEGKEGLVAIRDDYFKAKNKELLGFFALDEERNIFSAEERKEAVKERIDKKIKFKIIYTDKEEKKDDPDFTFSRFIPADKFPLSSSLIIYDDKVAAVSLKGKLVGVIIENKEITNTFKSIFELAWCGAEKYQ